MQLTRSAPLTLAQTPAPPPRSARAVPRPRPPAAPMRTPDPDSGDTVCAGKLHRWLDQEGQAPRTRFDARLAQLRARDAGLVQPLDKLLGTGKHTYWEQEHGYWGGPSLGDFGGLLFLLNQATVYRLALEAWEKGLLTDDQLRASSFLLPQLSMLAGALPKAGVRLAEAVQAGAELGCRAAEPL